MVAAVGTWAIVALLLLSDTTAPDGGAAPFSVKIPVVDVPPVTVLGFKVRDINDAGFTLRVAFRVVVPYVPEIKAEVLAATGVVVMVNVAEVLPAGIVTVPLAGT